MNNLACNNGECVRYGSVFNGALGDNELACQGGYAAEIHQMEHHKLPSKCFNAPTLVEDFDSKKVRTNLTCASVNDECHYLPSSPIEQGFSVPCKCGLSE